MFRIFKQQYTVLNKATGERETRQTSQLVHRRPAAERPPAEGGAGLQGPQGDRGEGALSWSGSWSGRRPGCSRPTRPGRPADRPSTSRTTLQACATRATAPGTSQLTERRLELLVEGVPAGADRRHAPGGVLAYLAKRRRGQGPTLPGRAPKKMSRETSNHYIRAVKAFAAWLVPQRRGA
jgi:hypothetical protein